MSIWGWVAIGIVALALIVLVVVALGTVRRLKSLKVAADGNAATMNMDVQALQGKIAGLQGGLVELEQRMQITQERIAHVKG